MRLKLRKLGYKLGFTQESKEELSDLLHDTATVTNKKITMPGPMAPFKYNIALTTKSTDFYIDNRRKLYENLEVDDKVRVSYREVFRLDYDYIPPDFEKKQFVRKLLKRHLVENVEKIE